MFKITAASDELADLMRHELFANDANRAVAREAAISQAAQHMVEAANVLDELGLHKQAEAITNMLRYANAVAGKITINETKSKLEVEIKDNGRGFSVQNAMASEHTFGLHNIIERSRAIGGEAKIYSSTHGTIITIEIPKKTK